MNNDISNNDQEEKPPVFKSWKGWYALLIIVLAVLVFLFYLLTKTYS